MIKAKNSLILIIVVAVALSSVPVKRVMADAYWNGAYRENSSWSKNADGTWSFLVDDKIVSGWMWDNDKWYYLNPKGIMQTGWLVDDAKWYYLNPSGDMQIGNFIVDGKNYATDNNGAVAKYGTSDDTPFNISTFDLEATQKAFDTVYKEIDTSQYTGYRGFNESKYYNEQGVAYKAIMNVLKAYAEGKIDIDKMYSLNKAPRDKDGLPLYAYNDPYVLSGKVWWEPSTDMWTRIGGPAISAQKVTVKLDTPDKMFAEAYSKGLYSLYKNYIYDSAYPFKEIMVIPNLLEGTATIARLVVSLGDTLKDDGASGKEPGYCWPYASQQEVIKPPFDMENIKGQFNSYDYTNYDKQFVGQGYCGGTANKFYWGIAYTQFEFILKDYATGKVDMDTVKGLNNPATNEYGVPYVANKNKYDLGHKSWSETYFKTGKISVTSPDNIILNKVTVKLDTPENMIEEAKSKGFYNIGSLNTKNYDYPFTRIVVVHDKEWKTATIVRAIIGINNIDDLSPDKKEPGYKGYGEYN
jgi:hypothetical protein